VLYIVFDCLFVNADTADKVARRPHDVLLPVDSTQEWKLFAEIGSRLAFQGSHDFSYSVLGWNDHDHMQMIHVEANRLQSAAWHTSQQMRQQLSERFFKGRFQNLPAVFTDPHDVILEAVSTVG